jgi:hypothetical protein
VSYQVAVLTVVVFNLLRMAEHYVMPESPDARLLSHLRELLDGAYDVASVRDAEVFVRQAGRDAVMDKLPAFDGW